MDPRIRLKMKYMDERLTRPAPRQDMHMPVSLDSHVLTPVLDTVVPTAVHVSGEVWYNQQAWRAVNQSIGRIIRHKDDYGAIILCDERFSNRSSDCMLAPWLQHKLEIWQRFGDANMLLRSFFTSIQGTPLYKVYYYIFVASYPDQQQQVKLQQ